MSVRLQPEVKSILFDTQAHADVLEKLCQRKLDGLMARNDRADFWRRAEDLFQAYIPETDLDAIKRSVRENEGIPQYTTVTIPYAYATLMTMHTYFASVFLSRSPVLQVQGRHAESVEGEQGVETILDYQLNVGPNMFPLYIWLLDAGKYGEGWVGHYWDTDVNLIPEVVEEPVTFAGYQIFGMTKKVTNMKQVVNYQGNVLFNLRPQDVYFDPTVTAANVQKGSYVGWQRLVSRNSIDKRAAAGYYFNTDKITPYQSGRLNANRTEGALTKTPMSNYTLQLLSRERFPAVLLDETVIELVPREWGLAPRDNLEKWVFSWANESVLIGCQPLGMYHNKYPIDLLEYEIEGYNISKRGMLEIVKPLNDTLDWLLNTHFYNVRKALNNEWIYDPSVLMQRDVERPGPGKLVRVRPDHYGADITKSFYQVQVMDVTQNHIRDSQLIIDMMQRLTGVNDSVMGVLGNTRRTATEVRTSSSFAVNRLKTLCEYISATGFSPLTQKMIANTQQLLDGDQEYRIRGADGRKSIKIDAASIAGAYDYVPVDGTLPIDRMAQAGMFGQLMQNMAQVPPVAQQMDFMSMFAFMAKNYLNIKNFDSFRLQTNVLPPGAPVPPGMVPASQVPSALGPQAAGPPTPVHPPLTPPVIGG